MNILSLFDGMSCGQIALRELGIKVDKYFASEIDKHAIAQTQLNFPETIQLGSVTEVKATDLPPIDMLIGGSPCQGFSFAGKQLNFSDPRSVLFFEYVRILKEIKEINPNVLFLLENVRMKRQFEAVISEQLGLQPVMINSALVSAQNRVRLYWTNIRTRKEGLFSELYTDIPQPKDKGCALTVGGKMMRDLIEQPTCIAMRGREACLSPRRTEYGKAIRKDYEAGKVEEQRKNIQQLEPRTDDKTNTLTTVQKDNLIILPTAIYQRPRGANRGGYLEDKTPTLTANAWEQNNLVVSGTFRTHKDDFGFREIKSGKAATIPARAREDGSGQNVCKINHRIRRLTPIECSRLQTIPSWYNWGCSETQIYKMLGNGWTVDVIKHIFKYINQ